MHAAQPNVHLIRSAGQHEGAPVLQIEDLTVRVGIRRVLERFTLDLFAGDCVCLTGPNGSGKSTLLNAIAGLEPARVVSGAIRFRGHDLSPLAAHERASLGITYLRQRGNVFLNLSVGENLRVALGAEGPDHWKRQFPTWAQQMPLNRKASLLSGGQQQRLAWAMAALCPSSLLLADEPEAGMSERLELSATRTILLASHQLDTWNS
jgi:ABC-type branched-subunit amino acid transport system ATPase component